MRLPVHLPLVAALLLLLAVPTPAQQAVEIQVRFQRDESVGYTFNRTLEQTLQVEGGESRDQTTQAEGRQLVRVPEVEADGTMVVELTHRDVKVTVGGQAQDVAGPAVTFRVRPDGTVVEVRSGDPMRHWPFPLPGRPVGIGETWTDEETSTEGSMTTRTRTTFTLAAVEQTAAGRVARIRVQIEGTIGGGSPVPLPPGATGSSTGTVSGGGEATWSLDRNRPLTGSTEERAAFELEMTAQGRTLRAKGSLRFTERIELVAAATAAVMRSR